jgi:hypothetical protein
MAEAAIQRTDLRDFCSCVYGILVVIAFASFASGVFMLGNAMDQAVYKGTDGKFYLHIANAP